MHEQNAFVGHLHGRDGRVAEDGTVAPHAQAAHGVAVLNKWCERGTGICGRGSTGLIRDVQHQHDVRAGLVDFVGLQA